MGIPVRKPDEELVIKAGAVLADSEAAASGDKRTHGLRKLLREDLSLIAHAAQHQNNGTDEINVAGLSGELADPQPPKAHKDSHKSGGGDAFTSSDLLEAYVKRLLESGGQVLLMGAVPDGLFLQRSGTGIVGASAGGAPTDAEYVVTAAHAGLSAEKVLGTDVIMADVVANRPAASVAGRLFFATDEKILYRDTSAAWVKVGIVDLVDGDGTIALAQLVAHASTHKHGGSDEVATATPGANVIPKAGAGGRLGIGFLTDAAINTILHGKGAGVDVGFEAVHTADLDNAAVTDAKLRDSLAQSVIGRSAGTNGVPADIQASADGRYLARAGGVLVFQVIPAADLPSHGAAQHDDLTRQIDHPVLAWRAITGTPTEVVLSNMVAWSLPDAATTDIGIVIRVPEDANSANTLICQIVWSTPTASGVARVAWGAARVQDNTTAPGANLTATESLTASATANRINITTLVNTRGPTMSDYIQFIFRRLGGDAADTLNDIMRIHAISITYTANQ